MKIIEDCYNEYTILKKKIFNENITTFEKIVSERDFSNAEEKLKNHSEEEILNLAKEGDKDAINYLYVKSIPIVTSVFWKYFLGPDKKFWRVRISNGEDVLFANESYLLLRGESDRIKTEGPLMKFNPELYPEGEKLNKFKYYFYRYLQRLAFSLNSELKKGGLIGNDTDKVKFQSLDAFGGNLNTDDKTIEIDSEENKTDIESAFEDFMKMIRRKSERDYQILYLRQNGYNNKEIGEKFNLNWRSVERILKGLLTKFLDFYRN